MHVTAADGAATSMKGTPGSYPPFEVPGEGISGERGAGVIPVARAAWGDVHGRHHRHPRNHPSGPAHPLSVHSWDDAQDTRRRQFRPGDQERGRLQLGPENDGACIGRNAIWLATGRRKQCWVSYGSGSDVLFSWLEIAG